MIKLLTFKTNQTILGDVEERGTVILIKNPVQVIFVPPRSNSDPGGIAFSPYLEYTEEFRTGIQIKLDDVLTITTPLKELLNQYNGVFGSGIQVASSLPKF
jgi:hypothetical protein